jgi:polysaccharide export outer membrane protein
MLFERAWFGFRMMQSGAAVAGLRLRGTDKGVRMNRRQSDGKLASIEPGFDDAIRPGELTRSAPAS